MPKDTCQAEVMLNSEKIKLVALAIIKLRLSEGYQSVGHSVAHSVSWLVGRSVEKFH